MNPENNLASKNNIENRGKEVTPLANIEQTDFELVKETVTAINADVASVPDTKTTIDAIESSISLANPSQNAEIKNEMGLDAKLQDLDNEVNVVKMEAESEIEALVGGAPNVASVENISKNEADGIRGIFESNPQLSEIGTQEQYESYLQTKFPREAAKNLGEGYIQTSLNSFFEDVENQGDVEKVEKDFLSNYVTMVSDEDFEKTKPYKTSEYLTMNQLLREGKEVNLENILKYKGMDPDQPQYILDDLNTIAEGCDSMKESIKKSYWSPHEAVFNDNKTYRVDFTGHLAGKNIGDVVEDKAFISTSIDKNQYAVPNLKSENDSTILIMNFPKNSIVNALYLAGTEKELVLPPDMAYEIKDKKIVQINGATKTVMEVEFLPNEHIHVLGSEKDIQGFKEYINKASTSAEEVVA